MFILDCHTHPTQVGVLATTGKMEKYQGSVSFDASVATLLAQMDHGDVNMAVILPWGRFIMEYNPQSIPNSWVAETVQTHAGRFIGFAGADPLDTDMAGSLERDVKQYGFKGLKIHPNDQGYAVMAERIAEAAAPLLEAADEVRRANETP